MAEYYKTRPSAIATAKGSTRNNNPTSGTTRTLSEFDKHREKLLSNDAEEGWALELRRYLAGMQRDVEKDTDIVEWWQVMTWCTNPVICWVDFAQDHAEIYPTLACIALDVLPSQASSVPCEWLFSGTKQVATDHRASLGSKVFEELTIMKHAWGPNIYDAAAQNAAQVDEITLIDFEQMLIEEVNMTEWDKEDLDDWNNNFELVVG